MEISFESVTVKTKGGRELLSNVSGVALPGSFTSLMGASGSGKTTLLATLSRRFEASLIYTGNVRYSGRKWQNGDRRRIAFVQQDDIVPPYLTVEEHLHYSSRLRLEVDEQTRNSRVETVIAQLRLEKCRKTLLGGIDARGVSGGERKRTSIANELLTEPLVLFTDEPTSGLDSTLSSVVIDILKDLTKVNGLTVVTTIHSPSSAIFEKFDSLLVLDEGRVFYRGQAKGLVRYLSDSLGKVVPPNYNPADYLMDVLVLDTDRKNNEKIQGAMDTFLLLSASEYLHHADDQQQQQPSTSGEMASLRLNKKRTSTAKNLLRNVSVLFRPGEEMKDEAQTHKFARSLPVQVGLLSSRLWRRYRKDMFTANQVGSTLGLAAISGLLFFQLVYTEPAIFQRVALSLWLVGTDMYLGVFSTVFAFHDDVPLLKKELYDGSYSLAAHVIAKQIVLYPTSGMWSLVFCTLVLLCSRLAPSVGSAVLAMLTVQAELFLFQGIGFLISAGVPVSGLVVVSVVVVTYFFAFNGFFSPFALMAPWYRWLRYPCFLTYSFQLVMQIVFPMYPTFQCAEPPLISAYPACENGSSITGQDVLQFYAVDLSVGTCIGVILGCGVAFRILSYFAYSRRMAPPKGINDGEPGRSKLKKLCCFYCRRKQEQVQGNTANTLPTAAATATEPDIASLKETHAHENGNGHVANGTAAEKPESNIQIV